MNHDTPLNDKEILDAIDDGALAWIIAADLKNWILLDTAKVRQAVVEGRFPAKLFLDDEGQLVTVPVLSAA